MKDIITVVVPVYNTEKYIRKCIESIVTQTYQLLDIILVNDGSVDNSGQICDEYAKKDARIRVIHKLNAGVSAARNDGIKNAKGKYLVFVDSDDYLEKEYCQKLYYAQLEYEGAFVFCGFRTINEKDKMGNLYIYRENESVSVVNKKNLLEIMTKWLFNSPCNKFYCVDLLREKNIFMPESLSLAEDLLFNFNYIDNMDTIEFIIINEPLYNYILHDSGSLDSKFCPNKLNIMKIVNERLYYICQKIEIDNSEDYYVMAMHNLEDAMHNNMKSDNPSSYFAKIIENNKIMRSKEYQFYLKKTGQVFSPFKHLVCKLGNYWIYMFATRCYAFFDVCKGKVFYEKKSN